MDLIKLRARDQTHIIAVQPYTDEDSEHQPLTNSGYGYVITARKYSSGTMSALILQPGKPLIMVSLFIFRKQ